MEHVLKEKDAQIEKQRAVAAAKQKQYNEQDVLRNRIKNNICFRDKKINVGQQKETLDRIDKEIAELSTAAHTDCPKSLDELKGDQAKLELEIATHQGQLQATQSQLQERQVDLRSNKYEKIDERYASCMIRLATSQMADEDLGKYYAALDRALMQYHDQKISEINDIIKELWIKTYRGQDIDYIELRSDVDQQGGGRGRNYNYRVVMVKGGTVLDMRGRCSAGQKVLASLVVRIALSQAFCCDCGILALDEPTTNLDSENIYSLGQALTELIHTRKGHSNFQLIIITHDEQFVRQIGHACGTEHVYHVTKDGEGQYSRITRRSMAEMM